MGKRAENAPASASTPTLPTAAAVQMRPPVMRRLAELIPVEYNPRKISEHQASELRAAMSRFGMVQPIVVNIHPGRENRIVGGEQRWRSLLQLGVEEALVVEVNLPLELERELNVRLNRVGGEWDWEKLEKGFSLPDLLGWGFERFDFPKGLENGIGLDMPPMSTAPPAESSGLTVTTTTNGSGGRTTTITAAPPPVAAVPANATRMVQLYFSQQELERYEVAVAALQERFGTEAASDTVLAALQACLSETAQE